MWKKLNFGKVQLMIFTKKAIYPELFLKGCFDCNKKTSKAGWKPLLNSIVCLISFTTKCPE